MTPAITNRVKELRSQRGLDPGAACRDRGRLPQSINSIERNRYVPSLELALTFARVFACPTDHIFQLENEK